MTLPPQALARPVREIARQIALGLLAAAGRARERLDEPDDAAALHDFRVSLRRLRSALRAYRPHLDESVTGAPRRRLRRLARRSGASRDLEVHLAWLIAQKAELRYGQRVGLAWLIRRLRTAKRAADVELADQVARLFPALTRRLHLRLSRYTVTVTTDGLEPEPAYAAVTTELLLEHANDMRRCLADVTSPADQLPAHEARIHGKRLRYLLEPVVDAVAGGRELLARLKELQDMLGELHDAYAFSQELGRAIGEAAAEDARRLSEGVLAGDSTQKALQRLRRRDPRPGLLEIASRVRRRVEQVYQALEGSGWLDPDAGGFYGQLQRFGEQLSAAERPPAGEEQSEPAPPFPVHLIAE